MNGWPGFDSWQGQEIFLFTVSKLALGPSLIFNATKGEADYTPSSKVKNGGAIPPLPHSFSWCGA
jgi:hypothetical protein